MLSEDYIHLITLYYSGNITPEEEVQLLEWVRNDSQNEHTFQQYGKIWEVSVNLKQKFDVDEGWQTFKIRVQTPPSGVAIPAHSFIYGIAVSIALVVGMALLIKVLYVNPASNDNYISMVEITSQDSSSVLFLPDSSKIYLSKDSKLSYDEKLFASERTVNLVGEAFFEVQRDIEHPFIIYTTDTKIRVLGTSFDVKESKDENEVSVMVVTGEVEFAPVNKTNETVILKRGEKGLFNAKQKRVTKNKNSNEDFMWWKKTNLKHEIIKMYNKIKRKAK